MKLCDLVSSLEIEENRIADFINKNKKALVASKNSKVTNIFAIAKIKITGPTQDTKWMDITLDELEKLKKICK